VGRHLEALLRDGYVVVPGAIDDIACVDAARDVDTFKARNKSVLRRLEASDSAFSRVVNLHLAIASLSSLFTDSDAVAVCDAFFEAETVLYTSLYFERGSEQDLHRDSPLFVTRPAGKYLGVWAALENIDAENGPLVVVPGSHKLPDLDIQAMASRLYGDPQNAPATSEIGWVAYQSAVRQQSTERGLEPLEVHVARGDVVVWHPSLFHGGAEHHSDRRTRRSLVMHVTPLGVPVYHQDVFFDPSRAVSDRAPWTYYEHHGRQIAKFSEVDFAHLFKLHVGGLQRPDASALGRVKARLLSAPYRVLTQLRSPTM